MKRLLLLLLAAALLFAQGQRDFLTGSEVEKIREAQEPNARLQLYVLFARQRMDQVQQRLAKDTKGRSLEVRSLLDEYEQIVEAMDRVSDDALKHRSDIQIGVTAVTEAEKKFLTQLTKIKESAPRDLEMYSIELSEAIATTKDSLDLADENIASRTEKVTAEADQEKKQVKDITTMEQEASGGKMAAPKDVEAVDAAAPGARRKPPTLLRDGEKVDDPSRPAQQTKPPVKPPPF